VGDGRCRYTYLISRRASAVCLPCLDSVLRSLARGTKESCVEIKSGRKPISLEAVIFAGVPTRAGAKAVAKSAFSLWTTQTASLEPPSTNTS